MTDVFTRRSDNAFGETFLLTAGKENETSTRNDAIAQKRHSHVGRRMPVEAGCAHGSLTPPALGHKADPVNRKNRSARKSGLRRGILAASIAALLATAISAHAQTTWTGGSAVNSNFSQQDVPGTFSNWDSVPLVGNDFIFGGVTRLNANNDFPTFTSNSITFDATAGAFVITGNPAFNGAEGITNNAANVQTISFSSLTLGAAQTWSANNGLLNVQSAVDTNGQALIVTTGAGQFNTIMSGAVTGAGSITKSGPGGILFLTNAGNNYSGGTTVNGGFVSINNANSLGTGNVTVASGGTLLSSATLTLANPNIALQPGSTTAAAAGTVLTLNAAVTNFGALTGNVVFGNALNTGVVAVAGGGGGSCYHRQHDSSGVRNFEECWRQQFPRLCHQRYGLHHRGCRRDA